VYLHSAFMIATRYDIPPYLLCPRPCEPQSHTLPVSHPYMDAGQKLEELMTCRGAHELRLS